MKRVEPRIRAIAARVRQLASPRGWRAADRIRRARAASRSGRHGEAADLYERALELADDKAALHVQCGHMHKEARAYGKAEEHYLAAQRLKPDDADLALQLGYFNKLVGSWSKAIDAFSLAQRLRPDWSAPANELALIRRTLAVCSPEDDSATAAALAEWERVAPELAPRNSESLLRGYREGIEMRRLGRPEPSPWGDLRRLRGVEAVRGICISRRPVRWIEILVNGLLVHRSEPRGPYPLAFDRAGGTLGKYVFNIWFDFAAVATGRQGIEIRTVGEDGAVHADHHDVIVSAPWPEERSPGSDGIFYPARGEDRPLEEQIFARPSTVRAPAARPLAGPVHNLLVLRTDQLGDLVASIAALERLRLLFSHARIVGLLTEANVGLARTLDLFDEIIVIDFPDSEVERRRTMPLEAQETLRRRLEPHRFDVAVDLAPSLVSRPLLRLSGARVLAGFGDGLFPWLTIGLDFNSHDPVNRLDIVPHAAKPLALVEALGAAFAKGVAARRRADLPRDLLCPFGIADGERYVLLHAGARIAFSRWPHFARLAAIIRARTELKVVLMTEDPALGATLPPELAASGRLVLIEHRQPFDLFDAFVSHAAVLVGNDSGPKHLASLRGVPAVTLFTARINWSEWGQEAGGAIISRRVPCAGCAIFHDAEECGKDFVCLSGISPEEVFDTLARFL